MRDKLNELFGDDVHRIIWGDAKYVKMVCKYKMCVYSHWFKFKNDDGTPTDLRIFRNIQFYHNKSRHCMGKLKEM